MVEQTNAPSLDRGPALANATQGAAPPASAGDDVAVQAETSPRSHRDASLPGEPPAAVEGGADQASAPSVEPTTTIAIASGLEAARNAHGSHGDDDLEHERVFYLTDEDFVRRQAMVSSVDGAEVGRATPPPPSVAIAHRRRLRRVVAYAMGTALMLCMVGIGHFLGRSLFSAPANAASASRPPPAATAPSPPSPLSSPAPASPPQALATASPARAPAPASPPKAPAGHASRDKRGAAEKRR
jgi:hypothetical protein